MSFRELYFSQYVCKFLEERGYNRPQDLVGKNHSAVFAGFNVIGSSEAARLVYMVLNLNCQAREVAIETPGEEPENDNGFNYDLDAAALVALAKQAEQDQQ